MTFDQKYLLCGTTLCMISKRQKTGRRLLWCTESLRVLTNDKTSDSSRLDCSRRILTKITSTHTKNKVEHLNMKYQDTKTVSVPFSGSDSPELSLESLLLALSSSLSPTSSSSSSSPSSSSSLSPLSWKVREMYSSPILTSVSRGA